MHLSKSSFPQSFDTKFYFKATIVTYSGTILSSTAINDYDEPMVTLITFEPNESQKYYEISIVNDENKEDRETFTASLSSNESKVYIVDGTTTITIIDDEGRSFTSAFITHSVCTCRYVYRGKVQ